VFAWSLGVLLGLQPESIKTRTATRRNVHDKELGWISIIGGTKPQTRAIRFR
jgi:hypothetical protein